MRRTDMVCKRVSSSLTVARRQYNYLNPLIYNRLNYKLKHLPLTHRKCKKLVGHLILTLMKTQKKLLKFKHYSLSNSICTPMYAHAPTLTHTQLQTHNTHMYD